MLSYELAKELKDAGFPQKGSGEYLAEPRKHGGPQTNAYAPTLEELIEKCTLREGNFLKNLVFYPSAPNGPEWGAFTQFYIEKDGVGVCGKGTTPTEAVARLWLAIQKK